MGIYRKVYQPFGGTEADRYEGPIPTEAYPSFYQLDWPGIVGTAATRRGTGPQPMDPGAGVLAPGASPEAPPASIQAPPEGTPGVAAASTSPWLLFGGA